MAKLSYTTEEVDILLGKVDSETAVGVTDILFVSTTGDNSDGSNWEKAYTTIQAALTAASTNANNCTLISLAPNDTFYDINTTGDPTWSGNYVILGLHRRWSVVKNTHSSATSVMKFTGKVELKNLAISTQGTINGVIITSSSFRITQCGFNGSSTTAFNTLIKVDGTAGTILGGKIRDVEMVGNKTYTTPIVLDNASITEMNKVNIHTCLNGVNIKNALSVNNYFENIDIGDCTKGFYIEAGISQHFKNINFHNNTLNISDDVGGHFFNGITGQFPIAVEPQDRAGVTVAAGDTVYGTDIEVRAAALATKPFKVIGYSLDPSNEETTLIRFSADGGTTYFANSVFATKKGKASGAGDATDFIFNVDTQITCSVLSPNSGRTVNVWLEIQEI